MIAITGASSQLGQYLSSILLKNGEQLKLLSKDPDQFSNFNSFATQFEVIEGDVTDVSSLELLMDGVEYVYHLEEQFDFSDMHKNHLFKVNVEGTENVINAALEYGVKKVLLKSSNLAIGDTREGDAFSEVSKWNEMELSTTYGWSKHLAEREMWRGNVEGVDILIVNSGKALLPGDWPKTWQPFFSTFYDNGKCVPSGKLPFISAIDLVRVMHDLMNGDIANEQFLVFSHQLNYKELVQMIAKSTDISEPEVEIPDVALLNKARRQKFKFWKNNNGTAKLSGSMVKLLTDKREFTNEKLKEVYTNGFQDLDETILEFIRPNDYNTLLNDVSIEK